MINSYYLAVEMVRSLFGTSEKENPGLSLENLRLFQLNVLTRHLYSLLAA
jgi:hypothetical protein